MKVMGDDAWGEVRVEGDFKGISYFSLFGSEEK